METLYITAPIYKIYTAEENALYYIVGADINKALEQLLGNKVNTNAKENNKYSVLYLAARIDNPQII